MREKALLGIQCVFSALSFLSEACGPFDAAAVFSIAGRLSRRPYRFFFPKAVRGHEKAAEEGKDRGT